MKSATLIRNAVLTALLVSVAGGVTHGQGAAGDYQRAERFLGDAVKKLVYDGRWRRDGSARADVSGT